MKRLLLILSLAAGAFAQTAEYPGALATDTTLLVACNRGQSTLSAGISDSATAIPVLSGATFDACLSGGGATVVTIDSEIIKICSVTGNTLNVCSSGRAFDGTSAAAHVSGRDVRAQITQYFQRAVSKEVQAIQTALGVGLANVADAAALAALDATVATKASAAALAALEAEVDALDAALDGAEIRSTDYAFTAQAPGGSLAIGNNTITLTPCPRGVNGNNTSHYLYVSGGVGTAEAVLLVAAGPGTCTSGAASGTVTITAANTHSGAWTIQSATAGIQEAIWAASGYASVRIPAGSHALYATVTKPAAKTVSIQGESSGATILAAQFASGDTLYVDGGGAPANVRSLQFRPGVARVSGAELHAINSYNGTVSDIFANDGGFAPYVGMTFENFIRSWHANLIVANASFHSIEVKCTASVCGGEFSDVNAVADAAAPAVLTITAAPGTAFAGMVWSNTSAQLGQYNVYIDPLGGTLNELQFSGLQIDSATTAAFAAVGTGSGNGISVTNVRASPNGGKVFQIGKIYSNVTISDVTASKTGNVNGIDLDGPAGVSLSNIAIDGSNNAGAADACLSVNATSGQATANVSIVQLICGRVNPPTVGLSVSAHAHAGLRIASSDFYATTPAANLNTADTAYANVLFGAASTALSTVSNFVATETGSNNAIAGALSGAILHAGLTVSVKLAHTLQAGANTFDMNGGGAVAIKKHTNPASNLGTAYAVGGVVTLLYDGTAWQDMSQ